MPILDASDYSSKGIFRNGHVNTMYPYIFRRDIKPIFARERFTTSDQDFVDLDMMKGGHKRLVILCHGLEGSSESQYMQHTSAALSSDNWDVMVFNFRSCSGEMNLKLQMYHSGFTNDLHEIIGSYEPMYEEISLVGFSLGGNMILKYTTDGLLPISPKISSVVAISTPADLSKSSAKIIQKQNWLYDLRFRKTLVEKIEKKHKQFPSDIPIEKLKKIKNLRDFDEYFTGPLHGFDGAEDYYSKCNCKQTLHNVTIPTLMITAQDDPFLTESSLPFEIANDTDQLFFMAPKFGGHVGFTTFGANYYWNEIKTLQFINSPSGFVSNHSTISDWL